MEGGVGCWECGDEEEGRAGLVGGKCVVGGCVGKGGPRGVGAHG